MLTHLYIKNYVLIQEISVDLSSHFNVFTGETGAGKSLLVDSLNFVSGQRSSSNVVGKYGDKALVEATFSFREDAPIYRQLSELSYIEAGDDLLVVTREINREGKNTCRINGRTVNVSAVRELLSQFIDIHSQFETQYLLNPKNQLSLLDSFMNQDIFLTRYRDVYKDYIKCKQRIEHIESVVLNQDELEFARFQLIEIKNINPSKEDYLSIKEEIERLEHFEKTKKNLREIQDTLVDSKNVVGELYRIKPLFEGYPALLDSLNDAYFRLEDISREVSDLNSETVFEESVFEDMQTRMYKYNQLIRKHGSLDNVFSKITELQNRIDEVDHQDEILLDLRVELGQLEKLLSQRAEELHEKRVASARKLEKLVVTQCRDLMLEHAVFSISFEHTAFSKNGTDALIFLVSMNKGEQPQPLANVASGGELSRVMLAMKVIFSNLQHISTLVFDEIDSGVSGRVSFKIGEKMKVIAKDIQVLTITHYSTVAACAQNHYLIEKSLEDESTLTSIRVLNKAERIEQLAMMMSGSNDIEALKAADKLYIQGQSV